MTIKQRLRNIELRLIEQRKNPASEPTFISLLDLPKETVIGAFGVLKDATRGYQCMLKQDESVGADINEYIALDQFSPEQLYNLMVTQRVSEGPNNDIKTSLTTTRS